jgi:hypothetical protein
MMRISCLKLEPLAVPELEYYDDIDDLLVKTNLNNELIDAQNDGEEEMAELFFGRLTRVSDAFKAWARRKLPIDMTNLEEGEGATIFSYGATRDVFQICEASIRSAETVTIYLLRVHLVAPDEEGDFIRAGTKRGGPAGEADAGGKRGRRQRQQRDE